MVRVLVAPAIPGDQRWETAHCMACWSDIYLTAAEIHELLIDRGKPVLCRSCANILTLKGTLA